MSVLRQIGEGLIWYEYLDIEIDNPLRVDMDRNIK